MHSSHPLLLAGLIVALPAALILYWTRRAASRSASVAETLERVSAAQLTEVTRESCESDPRWFLAGPRTGRPSAEDRQQPDADVRLPRPSAAELPFEFFPYDENFLGSSTASPRFPEVLRRVVSRVAVRARSDGVVRIEPRAPGLQIARLDRLDARAVRGAALSRAAAAESPAQARWRCSADSFCVSFAVAVLAGYPIVARVTRLTQAARESARQDYAAMAPISGADEISSLAFVFNEAAADIRRRAVDAARS